MEIMQGKITRQLCAAEFAERAAEYGEVLVDLGTGDGRFALETARRNADTLAVGVDACRENLRETSRRAPANALFVIAGAEALPAELTGRAGLITINFPWGSLRDGLLNGDDGLLDGIRALARPRARLEVRLNASALAEAGYGLVEGGERAREALAIAGFAVQAARRLDAAALKGMPSTWAKRLAFGRSPEALLIVGRKK
jgi:hypothetical protein